MSTDDLKQKTVAFIQELRNIRDEAIKGNLEKYRTWNLVREKLNDYESDLAAKPYQFPGGEPQEFFKCVKCYYWNILYSLFGEELTKLDPLFDRGEVPILLPGIECLFESEQSPAELPIAPDTQTPGVDTLTDKECLQKLADTGFITENTNIKTKTVYAKTRAVTVPKIYKELLKMTNDNERAERIMRNNISGVEAGLKQYLSRLSKRNKK
jgi:hypothetical protein